MVQKKKDRMLKVLVCYCIGFLTLIIVAVYVGNWFGIDNSELVAPACTVFGGELLLTCVLKLMDKNYTPTKTTSKRITAVKKESEDDSNG